MRLEFRILESDKARWCVSCSEIGLGYDAPTIPKGEKFAYMETGDSTITLCMDHFREAAIEESMNSTRE